MTDGQGMSFLICLIILGLLCVLLEFFLPSGIVGIIGGAVLAFAIVLCYTSGEIGPEPWKRHAWAMSIFMGTGLWIWALYRALLAGGGRAGMMLSAESAGVSQLPDAVTATQIEEQGVALTDLKPVGYARFGDQRYECRTESGFIAEGSRVRLVRKENWQRVVIAEPASADAVSLPQSL